MDPEEPKMETFKQSLEDSAEFVHKVCRRILGDSDLVKDAVQETFFRAWRSRETYDLEKPIRPWLSVIARNACLDELRNSYGVNILEINEEIVGEDADWPGSAKCLAAAEIRHAVSQLEEREQRVLTLRYENELSYKEISILEGVPTTTITNILHVAKAKVEAILLQFKQEAARVLGAEEIPSEPILQEDQGTGNQNAE